MSTKWKHFSGELYRISCPQSGNFWLGDSIIFHVHEVEKFDRSALLYFVSTELKILAGELFHVHKVEKFDWSDVRYFMSPKWKSIFGELYDISISTNWKTFTGKFYHISLPQSGSVNLKTRQNFMYTKWNSLTGALYNISCPRSGKVKLDRYTILHVHKVEKLN